MAGPCYDCPMKNAAAYITAFLTGVVISVMVVANTNLGVATTNEVSMIVNQAIGVVLVSAILLAGRRSPVICPPRTASRWYMYFGGIFGIFIMIANFYSVSHVGAGLAMAAAVFGQSITGLVLDLTGAFGMQKRTITRTKALSIAVSFLGIVVMSLSRDGTYSIPYILMGIGAGVLTMLQMCYNSSFAKHKGALFSARQNALSGLAGTLVYAFILMPEGTMSGFTRLPGLPFSTIVLGGTLAIVVVSATNLIIPMIPAVYSSLLMSSGQILASVVLDAAMYSLFSTALLAGALIMLAGIALNFIAERKRRS